MTMNGVTARLQAFDRVLEPKTERGIHAHHNLTLGVANSLVAVEAGAVLVDASIAGMGAGAGHSPIVPFIAVAVGDGWALGVDLVALASGAGDTVRPFYVRQVPVALDHFTSCFPVFFFSFPTTTT